jgi:hypothetical protein
MPPKPHPSLLELQHLHDQLMGLSEFLAADHEVLRQLPTKALPVLTRLESQDMSVPWLRQVRASRELLEMAAAETAKPLPQWRLVLTALNAALYPWAHLPQVPSQRMSGQ